MSAIEVAVKYDDASARFELRPTSSSSVVRARPKDAMLDSTRLLGYKTRTLPLVQRR